ncbi:MAG: HEAT repeat domain-containing protein, partial [Planctomycetes bacterium]|nr:HEAT repeat domain-containing protein [Planctomycetota bacterium]
MTRASGVRTSRVAAALAGALLLAAAGVASADDYAALVDRLLRGSPEERASAGEDIRAQVRAGAAPEGETLETVRGALVRALDDAEPAVRVAAARALAEGPLPDARAAEAVVAAYGRGSLPDAAFDAALAGAPAALEPALFDRLRARIAAAAASAEAAGAASEAEAGLLRRAREINRPAAAPLVAQAFCLTGGLADEARRMLLASADANDLRLVVEQYEAARAVHDPPDAEPAVFELFRVHARESRETLLTWLKDPATARACSALRLLAEIGDEQAQKAVATEIESKVETVQREALRTARRRRIRDAAFPIDRLLRANVSPLCDEAAQALATMATGDERAIIERHAAHPREPVRLSMCAALARLDFLAARPVYQRMLADASPAVRAAAALALGERGEAAPLRAIAAQDDGESAHRALLALGALRDGGAAQSCLRRLALHPLPADEGAFSRRARESDLVAAAGWVLARAADAGPPVALAGDPAAPATARANALVVLGTLASREAEPAILAALGSQDALLRRAAAWAAGRIAAPAAFAPLVAAARDAADPLPFIEAAGACAPAAGAGGEALVG